jgi:hypothetical protein
MSVGAKISLLLLSLGLDFVYINNFNMCQVHEWVLITFDLITMPFELYLHKLNVLKSCLPTLLTSRCFQAQAHFICEFFLYGFYYHVHQLPANFISMVKSCLHGETFLMRWPKPRHGGDWKMPINMTFSPPILFFASSSTRHLCFFFHSSFFPRHFFSSCPSPTERMNDEQTNERTKTNKEQLPSTHLPIC